MLQYPTYFINVMIESMTNTLLHNYKSTHIPLKHDVIAIVSNQTKSLYEVVKRYSVADDYSPNIVLIVKKIDKI
jgi:hypothetical protein